MAGIFYGGGAELLLEQALANGAAIVWSFAITFGLMKLLAVTIGVRVDEEQEATGLDLAQHAETAYHSGGLGMSRLRHHAHPRQHRTQQEHPMKLITAIVKPFKLDEVKAALKAAGVTGITVSEVRASAARAVTPRCTEVPSTTSTSCPRCRLEIVVADESTSTGSIDAIVEAARTGKIGDGKIWVTDIEQIVRIRTGESGVDAI